MYWRERQKTQYSWHNTFLKWILKDWRQSQSYQGAREFESDMSNAWRPSEDALSILEHAGISHSFIEDAIPEFVLYWRERGLVTSTWNTKFIAHVRRQWAKFTLAVENDPTPRLILVTTSPARPVMKSSPWPILMKILPASRFRNSSCTGRIEKKLTLPGIPNFYSM